MKKDNAKMFMTILWWYNMRTRVKKIFFRRERAVSVMHSVSLIEGTVNHVQQHTTTEMGT